MISTILSFFTGFSKNLYIYIILGLTLIIGLFSLYHYAYNKGSEAEKNKLALEYSKILEERIKENSDRISAQYDIKLKALEEKKNIEYVYIERKKEVEKIVDKSDALNNANCYQEDDTFETLKKATRKPTK